MHTETLKTPQPDIEELRKALDIAAAGTQLKQPLVDKVIQTIVEVNNPIRQNFPRKPGSGSQWILNQRSARGTGAFVNDTEEPTESQSTYLQKTFDFKTILFRGKVTRKLRAQGRTLLDIEAEEINNGLQVVRDLEEDKLINGSVSGDPKEFDGLRILSPGGQTVTAGTNGSALTLNLLDETIDKNRGRADMMFMSRRTKRELEALLQAQQRFPLVTEVKGGFRLMTYQGIPIFDSIFISDAQTQGSASDASDLFVVDTTGVWIGELTPLRMERLANKSSQFSEFDIFEDQTLVLGNDLKLSRLEGLIPA